jgi:hypothetical protein
VFGQNRLNVLDDVPLWRDRRKKEEAKEDIMKTFTLVGL